jgi:hypothetical protein
MNLALIKNNLVDNIIVIQDESGILDAQRFYNNHQYFIIIDELEIKPSIGWSYDGSIFSEPVE